MESTLIVDIFSKNYGRISLIAKGARRKKSKFRGLIRPFHRLRVDWSGKNDVPVMSNLSSDAQRRILRGKALYSCYYLNELLSQLLHQLQPNQELFDLYESVLEKIADSEDLFTALRYFEKHLLKALGYELRLTREANSSVAIRADRNYHYDPESGPIPTIENSENVVPGSVLLAIDEEKYDTKEVRAESRKFLRRIIEVYVDRSADQSRKVLQQVMRLDAQSEPYFFR